MNRFQKVEVWNFLYLGPQATIYPDSKYSQYIIILRKLMAAVLFVSAAYRCCGRDSPVRKRASPRPQRRRGIPREMADSLAERPESTLNAGGRKPRSHRQHRWSLELKAESEGRRAATPSSASKSNSRCPRTRRTQSCRSNMLYRPVDTQQSHSSRSVVCRSQRSKWKAVAKNATACRPELVPADASALQAKRHFVE